MIGSKQSTISNNNNETNARYLRPPSYETLIKWVINKNKKIDEELIVNSFKITGPFS